MGKTIQRVALSTALVATGLLVSAAPASARCNAPDPVTEQVVCGVGYGGLQYVSCNVTYKVTGCLT